MSSNEPDLYQIVVVQDRYQGVYSNGRWFAVARADDPFEGMSRLNWLLENGPGSDDVTCAVFWGRPPPWIAAAATPDEAVAKLRAQPSADTDNWMAPRWEDDPRSARWLRFLKSSAERGQASTKPEVLE